jgi:hypothetical protein
MFPPVESQVIFLSKETPIVNVLDLLKILTTPSLQSAATGTSEEFGTVMLL